MDSENKCFHKRPVTRPQKEIAPSLPSDNRSLKAGFPIRRFPDQSLFAAPRDLSQRTTSFIASQRQGIHRIPFRHLIALIARMRPGVSPGQNPDDSKRPVLLQTHPGSLRSGRGSRLVCSRPDKNDPGPGPSGHHVQIFPRRPRARLPAKPPCRSIRPRPNALPLHNVKRSNRNPARPSPSGSRVLLGRADPLRGTDFPRTVRPAFFGSRQGSFKRSKDKRNGFASASFRLSRTRPTRQKPARPEGHGGARRDRTDDLMLAKHALSQLSYGPEETGSRQAQPARSAARPNGLMARQPGGRTPAPEANQMVGLGGLEPPTSRLSSARSNQLSYKPFIRDQGRRAGGQTLHSSVIRRPMSERKRDEGGVGNRAANAA